MEKIPYKPGDVLVRSKLLDYKYRLFYRQPSQYETILDVSKNEYLAFLDGGLCFTKEQLDEMEYSLKTPAKWMPEDGEEYFFINSYGGKRRNKWNKDEWDKFRLKNNNVFRTEEEAEKALNKIMNS